MDRVSSDIMEKQLLTFTGNRLLGLLKTMRPKQWTKNFILFAGIIFSGNLFNMNMFLLSLLGFILFCIFSGSVYIINDIVDIEKDREHPKKCKRPLAAGHITVVQAIIFLVLILGATLFISFVLNWQFAIVGLLYFLLVTLYSFILKNIVIVDVMVIALGFVLRAVAGAVLIGVRISPWLLICTIFLSLFLALNKRKNEIELLAQGAKSHRAILEEYTPELINEMLSIVTASTLMAYALYTFTSEKSIYFMGTIPFVIYGIFRYQYVVHKKGMGGNPELILLQDKPLIIDILLWTFSCVYVLYFL